MASLDALFTKIIVPWFMALKPEEKALLCQTIEKITSMASYIAMIICAFLCLIAMALFASGFDIEMQISLVRNEEEINSQLLALAEVEKRICIDSGSAQSSNILISMQPQGDSGAAPRQSRTGSGTIATTSQEPLIVTATS